MKKNKRTIGLVIVPVMLGILLIPGISSAQDEVKYTSGGRRDPFVPLAGVVPVRSVDGVKGLISVEDAKLQGVVMAPSGNKAVIINGEVIEEGVTLGNLTVKAIEENDVVVIFKEKEYVLKLYE